MMCYWIFSILCLARLKEVQLVIAVSYNHPLIYKELQITGVNDLKGYPSPQWIYDSFTAIDRECQASCDTSSQHVM